MANLVFRDVSSLVKATVCGDYSSLRSTTVLRQNMTPTSRAPLAAVFLCGLVCLGANGAVRNRTEDLPIVFPDDNVANGGVGGVRLPPRTARRLIDVAPPPTHSGIPESLLFRMRDVRNYSDFVSQFLEGYPEVTAVDSFEGGPGILGKKGPVGGSAGAAAAVPNPEPGTCLPSKQLVEFPKPSDPTIILWPPCTRVPRCGGCCPSSILKCAPTKTSNVTFKVIKAQYPEPGASKFNFVGHEIVTLEKHDKCGCECKERPSDCNALQQYHECRCVCRNNKDMDACSGPAMLWDHRDCRCKCRDYAECSSGFFYNVRTCRCEQLVRSRIGSRILQPLPKLYGPYTDNRENIQSRSYRNLDLVAADDYSRAYTDVRAPPVRLDVTPGSTSTHRTISSSTLPQWRQRSTLGPRSTPFQRLGVVTTTDAGSTTGRRGARST